MCKTVAISGTTYAFRNTTVIDRVDRAYINATRNTILDVGGQTDLLPGAAGGLALTGAALLAISEAYADARRAAGCDYVVEFTVLKSTFYDAPQEAQRVIYNNLMKASTHFDAVVDVASRAEFSDPNNATYFYDGLHFTQAGGAIFASMAKTVLDQLLIQEDSQ